MEEVKSVKTEEKVEKKENFLIRGKRWVVNKFKTVCKVADENPGLVFEAAVIIGGVFIGGLKALASGGSSSYQEKCLIESDVSDQCYKVKHPLTNQEILELDDKLVDGMTTGEALDNMGLLRKERKRK